MKKYSLLLFDLDDTYLKILLGFDDGLKQTLVEHPITKGIDEQSFLRRIKQPPKRLINKLVNGEINTTDFKRERWKYALDSFNGIPEDTLFIGDSWTHDVLGPIEIGMDAIWVNFRNIEQPTSHTPYAIVSSVLEIRNILLDNKINR